MDPIINVLLSKGGFALGDFVFVMGEDIVHATGVDIELFAQVLGSHGRTFDVPAWESFTPRAIPFQVAARFGGFPQGKVAGVPLQRVGLRSDPFEKVGPGVPRQLSVIRKARHVEVDVAARFIGLTVGHQFFDDGNHFGNMLGGRWENVGVQDVDPSFVLMETVSVVLGDVLDCLALFQGG